MIIQNIATLKILQSLSFEYELVNGFHKQWVKLPRLLNHEWFVNQAACWFRAHSGELSHERGQIWLITQQMSMYPDSKGLHPSSSMQQAQTTIRQLFWVGSWNCYYVVINQGQLLSNRVHKERIPFTCSSNFIFGVSWVGRMWARQSMVGFLSESKLNWFSILPSLIVLE